MQRVPTSHLTYNYLNEWETWWTEGGGGQGMCPSEYNHNDTVRYHALLIRTIEINKHALEVCCRLIDVASPYERRGSRINLRT